MSGSKLNGQYLLLDSRNAPLARGELMNAPDSPTWQVRILDDKLSEVMEHEEIQLISMSDSWPPLLGRILRGRSDWVEVQKLKALDSDRRQNLRIPTHFSSFLYPRTGRWKGRRDMTANDLSCGGIAFFCKEPLSVGEELEIVVPITSQPVILRGKILRQRPTDREDAVMYAAKFVDMCNDEEVLVREAVFNIQLTDHRRSSSSN